VAIFRFNDDFIFTVTNAVLYAKKPGLMWRYCWKIGRPPNIAHPQRYSERMLWRKVLDHNPQFVLFSDKLATKDFLKARCPELPVPRTLWVGRDADAIPDELLRGDVFVKANHGCGFNHRIRGGQFDRQALRNKTRKWLRSGYGRKGGEWAYSKVEPRLFVEESVGDAEADLIEINVRAGNGKAILSSVMGRCKTPNQWAVYLDPEGAPTPGMSDPEGAPIIPLPKGIAVTEPYRRAVQFAQKLSVGVDYARFDFLWNGTELFGGEITVYPAAGAVDPANSSANAVTLIGWDLMQSHFLRSQHTGWMRVYADALGRRLKENIPVPVREIRREVCPSP
jgi:hypothetical protein